MTSSLHQAFADQRLRANPLAGERWAPQLKGQLNRIIEMLKTTPRSEWRGILEIIDFQADQYQEVFRRWLDSTNGTDLANGAGGNASEARTSRRSAQAKTTIPTIEHRRSTRVIEAPSYEESDADEADDSDYSHDPNRTYSKEHADAHPGEFYHSGNNRYKRRLKTQLPDKVDRGDSSASQALNYASSETSHSNVDDQSVHKDNLHEHPGRVFHHKGNGYYRPGVGPYGKNGTLIVMANRDLVALNQLPAAEAERIIAQAIGQKLKAVVPPTLQAPERTSGRVRRKSSIYGADTDLVIPGLLPGRRSSRVDHSFSSKESAASPTNDGTARDHSRRKQSSRATIENDVPVRNTLSKQTSRGSNGSARPEREELFETSYVHAHPNEIFHHRGQGRWARGLPPPGSSSKMAVHGRGAREIMDARDRGEDIDEDGNKPPGLTQLIFKAETEKWPNIKFYYRGGGKWWRVPPPGQEPLPPPTKRQRLSGGSRARGEGPEAQLQREANAAEIHAGTSRIRLTAPKPERPAKIIRNRSQQSAVRLVVHSKASSNSESNAPTPKPVPLTAEEDKLTEADLPELYKDAFSDEEELDAEDEVSKHLRDPQRFRPIVGADPFVRALTKFDPAVRSLESLKSLAANAQNALMMLQNEYLELDKIMARNPMNGKKERKPVHGGREPIEHQAWEDKKEATLYDYAFDPRRIGYQDPDSQKIVRDSEGRELRRRRNRTDPHATQVNYGDGEVTSRRTIKPVSRFDGVVIPPPRKKSRLSTQGVEELDNTVTGENTPRPSMTPERSNTPALLDPENYVPPSRGRWKGHVPKRIQELRGESVSSAHNEKDAGSPNPAPGSRKGRPPGSKNHAKRRDAGIKKGPRKPKYSPSGSVERETPGAESVEEGPGDEEDQYEESGDESMPAPAPAPNPMSLQAIMEPMSMPA